MHLVGYLHRFTKIMHCHTNINFWINHWHFNLLLFHCFLHEVTTEAEAFICRVTRFPVHCRHQHVSWVISHRAINYLHLALICKFVAFKILLQCLKQTVKF